MERALPLLERGEWRSAARPCSSEEREWDSTLIALAMEAQTVNEAKGRSGHQPAGSSEMNCARGQSGVLFRGWVAANGLVMLSEGEVLELEEKSERHQRFLDG